jgi:3-oxoacyl-[acyl-carrier protein] reductase
MNERKIALVTGASRGIGASIAKKLAEDGYLVIINYFNSEEKAEELMNELVNKGYQADIFKADVGSNEDVKEMISYIKKCYGRLDLLVNNAGISEIKPFLDITIDDWNKMINTNLTSVYNTCSYAVPLMMFNDGGKIINISSMWGQVGGSCESHYSASKGGVIAFTKALAKELSLSNILVNSIAPGCILTDMTKDLGEDALSEVKEETPLNKLGSVEDISNLVSYLASDKANFITGQVFSVNGGYVI